MQTVGFTEEQAEVLANEQKLLPGDNYRLKRRC